MERLDPVDAARALVAERFPETIAAFVTGSVLTSHRTDTSDLDIVVVRPDGSPVFRESLIHEGWPVELFVQTPAAIEKFSAAEVAAGTATLDRMLSMAVVVAGDDDTSARIQQRSRDIVAAGPKAASQADLDFKRYMITDLLDDLAGSTDRAESMAIAATLMTNTGSLVLLAQRRWRAGGKWWVRAVNDVAPGLADQLTAGLAAVAVGDNQPLVTAVDEILLRYGGRLWAGYYSEATLN